MKKIGVIKRFSAFLFASCLSVVIVADEVEVGVNLPASQTSMNYRPYVAVWVENEQGKTVKTLSVWSKEADWLKDMRRWWRKVGRYDQGELDGVSGATRRPGVHAVKWDGTNKQGEPVTAGKYVVNIEAAREHGSRSWVRQTVVLGEGDQAYTTKAAEELGSMTINVNQ